MEVHSTLGSAYDDKPYVDVLYVSSTILMKCPFYSWATEHYKITKLGINTMPLAHPLLEISLSIKAIMNENGKEVHKHTIKSEIIFAETDRFTHTHTHTYTHTHTHTHTHTQSIFVDKELRLKRAFSANQKE